MNNLENIPPETVEKLKQRIFRKIPDLGEETEVYIPKGIIANLTDEEFIVLWSLPNITIKIGQKTSEYVDERRRLLGLRADEHGSVELQERKSKPPRDEWDEAFGS